MENAELFPHLIKMMQEGHTITLGLRGYSMRPFLEDKRDSALMRNPTEVVVGEPVLAEIKKGVYVLHRVIKIEGENVTLLGDGNVTPEHCTKADVRAQIVGFYRKGRKTLDPVDGWKWRVYSWFWTKTNIWIFRRNVRAYLLAICRRTILR